MKRFERKIFAAALQIQTNNNMQFIQRFNSLYQNSLFINFELYQRFSENDFSKFANDKCLYCFKNDHIFKKNCFFFQKNITSQRIHIVDRRIFLKSQRSKTFQMRI